MEAFFSGTVILLYLIAHYAAEPIFVAACFLPTFYGSIVLLSLRFGACGRMIAAARRAKKMARRGVISGERRARFYKKCVKKTPPAFRAAYTLFSEGKMTSEEVALAGVRSVEDRRRGLWGGSIAIGVLASLAVLLTFYFIVPFAESLLRAAICAFHAALGSAVLHFALYSYSRSGEKAACAFAKVAEGSLLREKPKGQEEVFDIPMRKAEEGARTEDPPTPSEQEDVQLLKRMLRELDGSR